MTDTELANRLSVMEDRLRQLEDERDVAQVIAAYGPLVDAGDAEAVAALWEPDGVYDIDEIFMRGREDIEAMVNSANHQGWIAGGCAHFVGPPHVTIDGGTAIAVSHSLMVIHDSGHFTVRRATAHHWTLRRSAKGWRVTQRTSRVLDGRGESRHLLATGTAGTPWTS